MTEFVSESALFRNDVRRSGSLISYARQKLGGTGGTATATNNTSNNSGGGKNEIISKIYILSFNFFLI